MDTTCGIDRIDTVGGYAMAYGSLQNRVVLFSGWDGRSLTDTWEPH